RRCIPNPPSEWITSEKERLRIVPQELWDRVKARQARRTATIGRRVAAGLSRNAARRVGGEPKFPFSGLLKCGVCGANFIMAGKDHYACSTRVNGGKSLCSNDAYLKKSEIEPGLVAGIKRQLAEPEVLKEIQRRVRLRLKSAAASDDRQRQIAKLEREVN